MFRVHNSSKVDVLSAFSLTLIDSRLHRVVGLRGHRRKQIFFSRLRITVSAYLVSCFQFNIETLSNATNTSILIFVDVYVSKKSSFVGLSMIVEDDDLMDDVSSKSNSEVKIRKVGDAKCYEDNTLSQMRRRKLC